MLLVRGLQAVGHMSVGENYRNKTIEEVKQEHDQLLEEVDAYMEGEKLQNTLLERKLSMKMMTGL